MKIIVVGNGAVGSPRGHLIDKFDLVIRLSRYKIEGYECQVGTKTSIVSVAGVQDIPKNVKIWIGNPLGISAVPKKALEEAYPQGYVLNEDIKELYEIGGFEEGEHPTLGLLTIFMAIKYGKFFYDLPIYITGFNFFQPGWSNYYFEKSTHSPHEHHKGKKERLLIKNLIETGCVKLLIPSDVAHLDEGCPEPIFNCKGNLL